MTESNWKIQDILNGLVEISDSNSEQFLPQMLGFERLPAISYGKGCYPGQEVTARMHFKGGNKRYLYRIEWSGGLIAPGTSLRSRNPPHDPAGTLLNNAAVDNEHATGLAVLRDDYTDINFEYNKNASIKIIEKFN